MIRELSIRRAGFLLTLCGVLALSGCAIRQPRVRSDLGIRSCPEAALSHLLAPDALQCWFTASHGRWRTLSHESHYAVLVVNVEAADIRDAEAIGRQFVGAERQTFSEILVYVHPEQREGDGMRRVRWTTVGGFETLDFNGSAR